MTSIRSDYFSALGKIANNFRDNADRAIARDPLQWNKQLLTHGLLPFDPKCLSLRDDLRLVDGKVKRRIPLLGAKAWSFIDPWLLPFLCSSHNGYLCVYPDGACTDEGQLDLARAGFGVFFYKGCPWNVSSPLGGLHQASDRAELRAAVEILEASHFSPPPPHLLKRWSLKCKTTAQT